MLVLVGLGNPGQKYAGHRHNVGFMAVDEIVRAYGFSAPRSKFSGELYEGSLPGPAGDERALILKPQTFMNESGRSVGALANFYKVDPAQIIVFYDELDLAPGKVKVKTGGGAAGHNGIRSIAAHIGAEFRRVRIGIGHPGHKDRVSGYVLGDFSKADQDWLAPLLDAITASAPKLLDDDAKFASALALALGKDVRNDATRKAKEPTPASVPRPSKIEAQPSAQSAIGDALSRLLKRKDG